jgi:TIR domain
MLMARVEQYTSRPSRLLARMLDHRKPLDYLLLAAFPALPIALAWWIGALFTTADDFVGYGVRLNWTLLVVILPIAVYAMRWVAKRIGPVSSPELSASVPPVIGLIKTDAGREKAYAAFRAALLAPSNLVAAALITLLINVADVAQLGGIYLSGVSRVCTPAASPAASICAQELPEQDAMPRLRVPISRLCCEVERDWSVAYLSSAADAPGKWPNLALNVSAYSVQFAVVFIGIMAIILVFRHNMFFLGRIYQRRRVTPSEEYSYVHIDIDDKERCFGFRAANDAFNVQVLMLAVAGLFVLTTRLANAGASPEGTLSGLFPDVGQLLAVLTLMVALAIVSLPILVKLLPRMGIRRADSAPASLVYYLREFLSDDAWASGNETSREEIDAIAAQFAENAFWPAGNNRAKQIYFLSFWVLLIALVPDPKAIAPDLPPWAMPVGWAVAGALAWGATLALFRFLWTMLAYIDDRLVESPAHPTRDGARPRRRKIPIGVFISYRRDDTAAYAGRLYDHVSEHMDKDRVFMDLDKIPGGVDFVAAMKTAIESAQAMIVVMGPKWLTIKFRDGRPRIQDPSDFVHQELALGLRRGIRVFPVLVGGATMPTEADLPNGLKQLAVYNAIEITDSRWDHDVGRLIDGLKTVPARHRSGAS